MAHYALLNEHNIVTQVITGRNENELDNDGNVVNWEDSYSQVTGQRCLRTSYNTYGNQHSNGGTPFRGNYAGIGFTYNQVLDVFIPPLPFPSWKLNYDTILWEAPIPMPPAEDGYIWTWFEPNQEWIKITI
jgi:hypothetical protein